MRDRYLMATTATHVLGDVSRKVPDLALICGEDAEHWIGEWVTGAGFINVRFPKATTRELTADDRELYHGRWVQAGNGRFQILIPQEDA